MIREEEGGPLYRNKKGSKPTPQTMWDVGFAFFYKKQQLLFQGDNQYRARDKPWSSSNLTFMLRKHLKKGQDIYTQDEFVVQEL